MKNKKGYLIALITIIGLVIINQSIVQYFLYNKTEDSKTINIAGRQRMLSQRINQLSYRSINSDSNNNKEIVYTISKWKAAHLALMDGNIELKISGTENKKLYKKLSSTLSIINKLDLIITNDKKLTNIEILQINSLVDEFLPAMESIVNDFKKESETKLTTIINIEIVFALVTLLVIFIEFQLIIKPLLKNNIQVKR